MPLSPQRPCSPEEDGFANIRIDKVGILLDFGDHTVLIPEKTISRNTVVIKPGGNDDVNRVQLELLASNILVTDDAPEEVRVYP